MFARTVSLSLETENEIDRVSRNMEFFESRRMNWTGHNPPDTIYFETEGEVIVADGIYAKELPKKKLNRER